MAWFKWLVVLEVTSWYLLAIAAEADPRIHVNEVNPTHQTRHLMSEAASGGESGSEKQDWSTKLYTLNRTDYGSGSPGYDNYAASGMEDDKSGAWDTGLEKTDYSDGPVGLDGSVQFTPSGTGASEGGTQPHDWAKQISHFHQGVDKIDNQNGSARNVTPIDSEAVFTVEEMRGSGLQNRNEHTSFVNSGLDKVDYESGSSAQNNSVDNVTIDMADGESGSGLQYGNENKSAIRSGLDKLDYESGSLEHDNAVNYSTNGESGSGLRYRNETTSIAHSRLDKVGYKSRSLAHNNSVDYANDDRRADGESGLGLQHGNEHPSIIHSGLDKVDLEYESRSQAHNNSVDYAIDDRRADGESGLGLRHGNEHTSIVHSGLDKVDLEYESRSQAHNNSVDYAIDDRRADGESGLGLQHGNEHTSIVHSGLDKVDLEYESRSQAHNNSVDYAIDDRRADGESGSGLQHRNEHTSIIHSGLDKVDLEYESRSLAHNNSVDYAIDDRRADGESGLGLQHGNEHTSIVHSGLDKVDLEYESRSQVHNNSVDYAIDDRRADGESGSGLQHRNEHTSIIHSGLDKVDLEYESRSLAHNNSVDYAIDDRRADGESGLGLQHGNEHTSIVHSGLDKVDLEYESRSQAHNNSVDYVIDDRRADGESGLGLQHGNEHTSIVHSGLDKVDLEYESRSQVHNNSVDYAIDDRRADGESGSGLQHRNEHTLIIHSGLDKVDLEYESRSRVHNNSVDYGIDGRREDGESGSELQYRNERPSISNMDLNETGYGNASVADKTYSALSSTEDGKGESGLQDGTRPASIVRQGLHNEESENGGPSRQLLFDSNGNNSTVVDSTIVQSESVQQDRIEGEADYDAGLERSTNVLGNGSAAVPKQTDTLKIKNKLKASTSYKMKEDFQKHSPTFTNKSINERLAATRTKTNLLDWLRFPIKDKKDIKYKAKHGGTGIPWMQSRVEPGSNFLRLVSEMQPTVKAEKSNKNRKPEAWYRNSPPKMKLNLKANQDNTFLSRSYKNKTSANSFSGKSKLDSKEGRVDNLFRKHKGLIHNREHSFKTSSNSPMSELLKLIADFSQVAEETSRRGHKVDKTDNIAKIYTLEDTTSVSDKKENKWHYGQLGMKQLASQRKLNLQKNKAKYRESSSLVSKEKIFPGKSSKASLLNKTYITDYLSTKTGLSWLNNTRRDRKKTRFTNYSQNFIEFHNSTIARNNQLRGLFKYVKYSPDRSNSNSVSRSKALTVQTENKTANDSGRRRISNNAAGSDRNIKVGNRKYKIHKYYRLPKKGVLSQLHFAKKWKNRLKNSTTVGTRTEYLKRLSVVIKGTVREPMRNISDDSNIYDIPIKNNAHRSQNLAIPAKKLLHNIPREKDVTRVTTKSNLKKSTARTNASANIIAIPPVHSRPSGVDEPRIISFPFVSKEHLRYKPRHQVNAMPSNQVNVGIPTASQFSDWSVPFHSPELPTNFPKQMPSDSVAPAVPISVIKNQEPLELSNVPKTNAVSTNYMPFLRYSVSTYGPDELSTNQLQQSPLEPVAPAAPISVRKNEEPFELPNVSQVNAAVSTISQPYRTLASHGSYELLTSQPKQSPLEPVAPASPISVSKNQEPFELPNVSQVNPDVSTISQPYRTLASHGSYELSTNQPTRSPFHATTLFNPISSNSSPMVNYFSQINAAIPASSTSSEFPVSETPFALPNQSNLPLLYSSAPDSPKLLKTNPASLEPSDVPQYRGRTFSNFQSSMPSVPPGTSGYTYASLPSLSYQPKLSSLRPAVSYAAPLLSKFNAEYLESPSASNDKSFPVSDAMASLAKPLVSPLSKNAVMTTNSRGFSLSATTAPSQKMITPVSTTLFARNRNGQPFLNNINTTPWGRYPVNKLNLNQMEKQWFSSKNLERKEYHPKYLVTNKVTHTNPFRDESSPDINMTKLPVPGGTTFITDENTHPFEVGVPDVTAATPVVTIDNNNNDDDDNNNNNNSSSSNYNSKNNKNFDFWQNTTLLAHWENRANAPETSVNGNERDKAGESYVPAQIAQRGNSYQQSRAPTNNYQLSQGSQNGFQPNSATVKTLQLTAAPVNNPKQGSTPTKTNILSSMSQNGYQLSSSSMDSFKLTTAPVTNYQPGSTQSDANKLSPQLSSSSFLPPAWQENIAPTASDRSTVSNSSALNLLTVPGVSFSKPSLREFYGTSSIYPATNSKYLVLDDLPAGGAVTTRSPFLTDKKPLYKSFNDGSPLDILAQEIKKMSFRKPGENTNKFVKAPPSTQSTHKERVDDILPNLRVIVERKGKNDGRYKPTTNTPDIVVERKGENRMRLLQSSEQHTGVNISTTRKELFTTQKPSTTEQAKVLTSPDVGGLASETSETSKQSSTLAPTLTTVAMTTQLKTSSALLTTSGEDTEERSGFYGDVQGDTANKCNSIGKSGFEEKCPSGWIIFREYCYKFVDNVNSRGSWRGLPPDCARAGANLAMPRTNDQQEFLKTYLVDHEKLGQRYYVGLRYTNGRWRWADDTPLLQDVPSFGINNLSDSCGVFLNGHVRSASCSVPRGYICELKTGMEVIRVLALGDSLTQGYYHKGRRHHPYTDKLEYLLNKDSHKCFVIDNLGKERNMAADMARRLGEYLTSVHERYGWIVILGGTNDIVHRSHERGVWDDIANDIIRAHEVAHNYGARTLVVTIPGEECSDKDNSACNTRREERGHINDRLRRYALSSSTSVLCDADDKLPRMNRANIEERFYWEEGLHLTPQGYDRLSEIMYKDLLWGIEE